MGKESDHIHIIALSSALGVPIRVEYMDRGSNHSIIAHDFPEGSQPKIFLLYKPGHYDVLYKWYINRWHDRIYNLYIFIHVFCFVTF